MPEYNSALIDAFPTNERIHYGVGALDKKPDFSIRVLENHTLSFPITVELDLLKNLVGLIFSQHVYFISLGRDTSQSDSIVSRSFNQGYFVRAWA